MSGSHRKPPRQWQEEEDHEIVHCQGSVDRCHRRLEASCCLAGTADASHVVVEVRGIRAKSKSASRPRSRSALHDAEAGLPVANAPVTVYMDATFDGRQRRGQAGKRGNRRERRSRPTLRAAFRQCPRAPHRIPSRRAQPSPKSQSCPSPPREGPQLQQVTSGIQVPGLNVWLIIAIVAGVWSLLFSVGLRVFAIARADGNGRNDHGIGRAASADCRPAGSIARAESERCIGFWSPPPLSG